MSVIVLLAAGASRRTSQMKQLYRIQNEYLINKQIADLKGYGYDVVVILGHRAEEIASIINQEVQILYNTQYKKGMFSSIQLAFKTLNEERLVFCHIDRPIVEKEIFERLLTSKAPVATTQYQGKKAPPVMIQSSMRDNLLNSSALRLDAWVLGSKEVEHIEVDDQRVHFNANTDETLRRYFD